MWLDLEVRHWWTPGTACRVHVTPRWDGTETVTVVGSGIRRSPRPYPLVIERPDDARTLEFDIVSNNLIILLQHTRMQILNAQLLDATNFDTCIAHLKTWQQHPAATLWYSACWAEGFVPES